MQVGFSDVLKGGLKLKMWKGYVRNDSCGTLCPILGCFSKAKK